MRQPVGGDLHSYGRDFKYTSYIHLVLALIVFGLYEGLTDLPQPVRLPIHPAITLTIFGILEFLFNEWAWKLLRFFPFLHVYDFSGTYEGRIRAGDGTEYPAKLIVKQSWWQIGLDFESGAARSKSFSASITQDRLAKGHIEIVYNYYAHGEHQGEERVGAHYGTAMLVRQKRGTSLDGNYFTERSRDSFGHITLIRK